MASIDDNQNPEAVGWNAIDEALAAVYGEREPLHYGTALPLRLGGNDPLQGISVYKNLSPAPHYHYVTYGFSELFEKESPDPECSGYGFELTFRLACQANAPAEPPTWPLHLLQNLARYVFKTGNAFDERHHLPLNGPIALEDTTDITAVLLMLDPELNEIDTRNGHVKFLQLVGVCEDEYQLIRQGYFNPVQLRISTLAPLAITDIYRPSILQDEAVRGEIVSAEAEFNQREVFGTIAEWSESSDRLDLRIGATVILQLKAMLSAMIKHGGPIAVYGKGGGIVFESGPEVTWKTEESSLLIVSLTQDVAVYFAQELQPTRGAYRVHSADPLTIHVAPVEIKDSDGNIIKTVG